MGPWTFFNVREVCNEFSDKVILNDICIDDREVPIKHGIERRSGIFFDREPADSWGPHEKEEIRDKLKKGVEGKRSSQLRMKGFQANTLRPNCF